MQVGLLRNFAKLQPTSSLHHSQLYLLEHITEKALAEKNPETAQFVREWLSHFPGLTRDYLTLFMEEETYKYLFGILPKNRLGALPGILRSFHWFSDEYRAFEKEIRTEANKRGCEPQSLKLKRDWPDFKW